MVTGWYYLHTNGDLIYKRMEARPEEEPGGFVRKVWPMDPSNRLHAWRIAVEGLHLGARVERVKELMERWFLTVSDLPAYMSRERPITPERADGLRKMVEGVWGLDWDEVLDEIEVTPKGGHPDLGRFVKDVAEAKKLKAAAD